MSKAIQVYDNGKLVDIPEDEVENVKNMGRIFTEIGRVWESAKAEKISGNVFVSGVLKFLEFAVRRDPFGCIPGDLERTADSKIFQKIWKDVHSKVEEAKTIYYKNRKDFAAYQTFRIICNRSYNGRKSNLTRPNLDHCGSQEFCVESLLEQ